MVQFHWCRQNPDGSEKPSMTDPTILKALRLVKGLARETRVVEGSTW